MTKSANFITQGFDLLDIERKETLHVAVTIEIKLPVSELGYDSYISCAFDEFLEQMTGVGSVELLEHKLVENLDA